MPSIILNNLPLVAIVDEDDLELASNFRWAGKRDKQTVYARTSRNRKTIYLHRLVIGAPLGVWVDHINGDGLDCRRANLRLIDGTGNAANRAPRRDRKHGTEFKGVQRDRRGKWRARLGNGGIVHLGTFDTAEQAARAYDTAASAMWGNAARLNFAAERR